MSLERLEIGDEIRIIAPSMSMSVLKGEQLRIAEKSLTAFGFKVTYGTNVECSDEFYTGTITERLEDLHNAFADNNVKAIIAATGGFQTNQLLDYINYNLIKENRKIICGCGDLTTLLIAIHTKCQFNTYYGPNFATLGSKFKFDYTINNLLNILTNDDRFELLPSSFWSNDPWHAEEYERTFHNQDNYYIINEGKATGNLVGGNLSSFNLLAGTDFMPTLSNKIIFIEDDGHSHPFLFERNLQALLQLPLANEIKAILIGRFQPDANMTITALQKIISTKKQLNNIPIIANVNFGHVDPVVTLPIGATVTIQAENNECEIFIE